jgi:hypothetical protein
MVDRQLNDWTATSPYDRTGERDFGISHQYKGDDDSSCGTNTRKVMNEHFDAIVRDS